MKHDYFVVQNPTNTPEQLMLLFHGVGDNPVAMGQIGSWFAEAFPQALVVSIGSPQVSESQAGRQWFDVQSITEQNRQTRVDEIMPTFIAGVQHWQQQSGIKPEATALIGFSQGSIMALEAIKAQPGLAGRVVAFSGRFASLPEQASTLTTVHLIHGEYDETIALQHAESAEQRLSELGGDVTLDIVEDLAHAIDQRSMQLALDHLRYTVPRRYFDQALSGAKPGDDDVVALL
ncbi:esterase [Winslowiella sp. 2C04]|uniref:esterase n=1 Tax=Winslowiella sp. 2C04 TaxID=3416179 RepID=UPI003CE7EBDF